MLTFDAWKLAGLVVAPELTVIAVPAIEMTLAVAEDGAEVLFPYVASTAVAEMGARQTLSELPEGAPSVAAVPALIVVPDTLQTTRSLATIFPK